MNRQRTRGFTLVEVLAAMLILAFIMTTTLAVFFERQRRLKRADDLIVVYQALANEAEIVRQIPYASLMPGSVRPFLSDAPILDSISDADSRVEVKQFKDGVREVKMVITWNKGEKKVEMAVLRANTGPKSFW